MSEQAATTVLPLRGRRILVTRTPEQATFLSERLRALGAVPIEFPTIRIAPPEDWERLDSALRQLFAGGASSGEHGFALTNTERVLCYAWLVFTSANGVRICCERLRTLGFEPTALSSSGVRIACIGPATSAALAQFGLSADLVPGEYIAEGVAAALVEDARQHNDSLAGKRILLARAAGARKVLATELQQAGALVDEVPAYFTLPVDADDEQGRIVLRLLQGQQLDMLTFTSSSTVRNFMQWLAHCAESGADINVAHLLHNERLRIACIGPITSQTARTLGLEVHIEAREFTIDGLIEAIVASEENV